MFGFNRALFHSKKEVVLFSGSWGQLDGAKGITQQAGTISLYPFG